MKTSFSPTSGADINKIVYDILKQSRSFDVYPTPVDRLVEFAELYVDRHSSLHSIPNHYLSKNIEALQRALRKVWGALDRRKRIIYLEPGLMQVKKRFVQLHEVGHHTIPWQHDTFEYVDDEITLNPDILEIYEAEANFFASAVLFQLDRFEELIKKLPLEMKTIRYLARQFGGSIHAAMRRYAETVNRRCALIVLTDRGQASSLCLRNYFQSKSLTKEFGIIPMPEELGKQWPFVQDFFAGRIAIDKSEPIDVFSNLELHEFEYQYFYNRYNIFVLLTPKGEKIKSRTTILVKK